MILGFTHSVQLSVLMKAIGAGYALGLLYCIFMMLNSIWNKHTLSVFIRDILFFSIAAALTFLFALKYNAGIVRFYILAGELIGFCIFYIFPGSLTGKVIRRLADRVNRFYLRISKKAGSVTRAIREKLKSKREKIKSERKIGIGTEGKEKRRKKKNEKTASADVKIQRKKLCFKQKKLKKFVKPLDIKKY